MDLSPEEAVKMLERLCEEAGGVGLFAQSIGVTISTVSHQLAGRRPIQGKVAERMGIKAHREVTLSYRRNA